MEEEKKKEPKKSGTLGFIEFSRPPCQGYGGVKMNDFAVSEYLRNEDIYLENLEIENCRIAEMQADWNKRKLIISKCTLQNVDFDNHCRRGYVEIIDSAFTNCSFYDTLGNGHIIVKDSQFQNCQFENVYLSENAGRGSSITYSKFSNCSWKNVILQWNIGFYGVEIYGGSVENSSIVGQVMDGCQILHLQMKNVDLKLMLIQNRLENMEFENVVLNGYMSGKDTKKENIFKECDLCGFRYTEELSGFFDLDFYLE